jgi:Ca2+-transporting ATPase
MAANNFNIQGLTNEQILDARKKYGSNTLVYKKENGFLNVIKSVAKEPMVFFLLPPLR